MRKAFSLVLGGLLLSAAPALAAPPEAEMAKALEGRVAGEPVSCINLRRVRSTQVVDDTAILYRVGGTIYVNQPRSGAESLNDWDAMVTRTHSSRLCSIDVVRLVDTASGMTTGLVFLDEFVPYRKIESASLD